MTTLAKTRVPHLLSAPAHQPEAIQQAPSHFFSPETAAALAHEDHEAWNAVCTVLITIVSLGLLIGIVAILLVI